MTLISRIQELSPETASMEMRNLETSKRRIKDMKPKTPLCFILCYHSLLLPFLCVSKVYI
jgi:hypothetical protein